MFGWLINFSIHTRGFTDLSVSRMYLRFTTRITLQNFRLTIPNALGADFESPPDFCIPRPPTVWNWICVIQVIPLAKKIASLIVHSKKVYRNISVTKLRITTVLTSDDEVF